MQRCSQLNVILSVLHANINICTIFKLKINRRGLCAGGLEARKAYKALPKGPGPGMRFLLRGICLPWYDFIPIHPHPTSLRYLFIKWLPLYFMWFLWLLCIFYTPPTPHNHQWGTSNTPHTHPTPYHPRIHNNERTRTGAQFSLSILRIILFLYPKQATYLRDTHISKCDKKKTTRTTYDLIFFSTFQDNVYN